MYRVIFPHAEREGKRGMYRVIFPHAEREGKKEL
jgi:hypothetical protein